MKPALLILFFHITTALPAQTIGGNAVFNFLRLPASPHVTGLGGINVSQISNDIGLAFANPALLSPGMHTQLNTVFNAMYDDIHAYNLSFAYHHENIKTSFLWGLNYLDYGTTLQTDAAGNMTGNFRPTDWVMQLAASRKYLERWSYGATLKFINSNYGQYLSNGIAVDVGVLYHDTANALSVSVVAKNMGTQLRKYDGTGADDLPFDLQAGVSKRLTNAPFAFSFTAHHLHRFDIRYNDEMFNEENGFANGSDGSFTIDRLFRHFIIATTVYLGNMVEVDIGYNYLRRKELAIGNGGNGLTGFSIGAALLLQKLQVRYARSHYQNNTAYNQFGLNLTLNKYFGLKKFGERIGW